MWREGHRLHATDGSVTVFAQVEIRSSFAGLLVVVGGLQVEPLVISDFELPVPPDRWEFRSDGVWVEFVCEIPMVHWSYGLEAFALGLDDRRELLDRGYGRRTPLGWELEFTATEEADETPAGPYHQAGTVEGLLLDEDGEHEVASMVASRWHWWGSRPEPTGAQASQADAVALPTPDGPIWVVP